MLKYLRENLDKFDTERDYWRAMCARYHPRTKRDLQSYKAREGQWLEAIKKQDGRRSGNTYLQKRAQGMRKEGGGAKDYFADVKKETLQQVQLERSYGHSLSVEDVYDEFIFNLKVAIRKKEIEGNDQDLVLKKMQKRVHDLSNSYRYRISFTRRMLESLHLKVLKPQRLVLLTPEEEKARAHVTWQGFDEVMWLAAYGSEEDLRGLVVDPKEFIKDRKDIVMIFTDQVPYWAKLGASKQVYLESECRSKKEKNDIEKRKQKREG